MLNKILSKAWVRTAIAVVAACIAFFQFGVQDSGTLQSTYNRVKSLLSNAVTDFKEDFGLAADHDGSQYPFNTSAETLPGWEDVPEYTGDMVAELNGNVPYFDVDDLSDAQAYLADDEPFEDYSDLDTLGRCGPAYALIGLDTMPTEEREDISSVKPSGWHNEPYDFIDGGYLYNRCHIIGFQLAGENANEKNLITGTRSFNTEAMLPYENAVAEYIHETGNHVLYRVTPVYNGLELVCRGVIMEGYSVEDNGDGVCYCVFCFNVQNGVEIDYLTGYNKPAQ